LVFAHITLIFLLHDIAAFNYLRTCLLIHFNSYSVSATKKLKKKFLSFAAFLSTLLGGGTELKTALANML
jgi:uncharacterized protein with von Willebrand factor type A (vWA) domain